MDGVQNREPWNEGVSDVSDEGYRDSLRRMTEPAEPPRSPPRPSAETEAMGQMLMEAINREIAVRAQLIEARRLLEAEVAS